MTFIHDHDPEHRRTRLLRASLVAGSLLVAAVAVETYRLYRPPPVTITRIDPCCFLPERPGRARVLGTGFRPYLRARVAPPVTVNWRLDDSTEMRIVRRPGMPDEEPAARAFAAPLLVETPTEAELQIPTLAPGTYDLVLYDDVREVARLPKAIVVEAPATSVDVRGSFVGLTATQAQVIASGALAAVKQPAWWGSITWLGGPVAAEDGWEVPAVLKLRCVREDNACVFGAIPLTANAVVMLTAGDRWTQLTYRVDDLPNTDVEIDVRALLLPEVAAAAKRTVPVRLEGAAGEVVQIRIGAPLAAAVPAVIVVHVRAESTEGGWRFGDQWLRVGEAFSIQAPGFTARGVIVGVRAAAPAAGS